MPTNFDISKLTNVTDGGSPDIGENPTSGYLKDLIDEVVNLSDALINKKDKINSLNNDRDFFLGEEIVDDVKMLIRILKDDVLKVKQINYENYHASELPAGLEAPYYK